MGMSKRALGYLTALVLTVVSVIGLSVGAVAAHHPIIEGSATRACGAEATWTATFQARADLDRNKQWRSRHKIDNGNFTAFTAWADDASLYGPYTVGPFTTSKASVTITVVSQWHAVGGRINDVELQDTKSITIARPNTTTCPPPSSSSTSTTSTSTTSTTSTTTTVKETTTTQETTTSVRDTTTTDEATTTTQKATTTTAGETTTSEAATTTVDPGTTTTTVAAGTDPTPPPQDTTVDDSTPAPQPDPELPTTGGVDPRYVWWGLFALGTGIFLIMITRRPTPRN